MPTILIVDDEPLLGTVVGRILLGAGYLVHTAECGDEAADLIKRVSVDLVLTDLVMPSGDGMELIAKLKLQPKRVPVVVMTGDRAETERLLGAAVEQGAARILVKPFTTTDLLECIDDVLRETGVSSGDPPNRWGE
jgi:DNA-binding response OmpR family regulator